MFELIAFAIALATSGSAAPEAACLEYYGNEDGLYCLDDGHTYGPGSYHFETFPQPDGTTATYAVVPSQAAVRP